MASVGVIIMVNIEKRFIDMKPQEYGPGYPVSVNGLYPTLATRIYPGPTKSP
jgi:hypothetical protein